MIKPPLFPSETARAIEIKVTDPASVSDPDDRATQAVPDGLLPEGAAE